MPLRTKTDRPCIPAIAYALLWALSLSAALTAWAASPATRTTFLLTEHQPGVLVISDGSSLQFLDADTATRTSVPLPPGVRRITDLASNRRGRLYLASWSSGLWISDDGGRQWTPRKGPWPGPRVTALATHATQPDTIYAYLPGDGIYRSRTAARDWELMDGGPDGITGPLVHTDMPDSMETGWIFAGTRQGVSRSMDCFCLWRDAGMLGASIADVTYNPRHPATLYAIVEDRVWRSRNGGEQWARMPPLDSPPRALTTTLAGRLYALDAKGIIYAHDDRGAWWTLLSAP